MPKFHKRIEVKLRRMQRIQAEADDNTVQRNYKYKRGVLLENREEYFSRNIQIY